ncbi:MAG: DUF192 domain-containing protein [Thermoanaerobaculia bacterium]
MKVGLLVVLMLAGCANPPAVPAAPVMAEQQARVIFPDGFAVEVEVASDDTTRAQGLMFRDRLRQGTGMIFFFPSPGIYPFWMKNTLIPLDMIWIDGQKRIVSVTHDVPPCKAEPCASYPPGGESLYVLEVAAGVAREHGLKAGDVLKFERLDGVVVR